MKAYRIKPGVYLDCTSAARRDEPIAQEVVYIPERGIIGYYPNGEKEPFFNENQESIDRAYQVVAREHVEEDREDKYLGEIELPDEVVLKVISDGKKLNQARTVFQESVSSLIDLL